MTAAGLLTAAAFAAPAQPARATGSKQAYPSYAVKQVLSGANVRHTNSGTGKKETLTEPDGITQYGGDLYAAFQNGVGSQGQASASGNQDSTIVEFGPGGSVLAQWDVRGQAEGLAANPATGEIVVTVNQDAHSSIYSIEPGGQLVHYGYNEALPNNGGTDEISFYKNQMLVSASAPGTTGAAAPQPKYPAVYSVTLNQTTQVATVKPYFYDESSAKVANNPGGLGANVTLALTDPTSTSVVPSPVLRWRGDFVLSSQANREEIFSSVSSSLWVLKLSQAVGDTVFSTAWDGALYATNQASDSVDVVDSRLFWPGTTFVTVTPCAASGTSYGCAANYLGRLNLVTGQVTPVSLTGVSLQPTGLIFVPASSGS